MKSQFGILLALAAAAVLASGCGLSSVQQVKAQQDLAEAYNQAQNGNIARSHEWCDRAVAVDPKNPDIYIAPPSDPGQDSTPAISIAGIYSEIADDPSLVLYMTQATQKFPNNANAWIILADADRRLGKTADEQAAAKQAIAILEPKITQPGHGASAELLNNLATAYQYAGNYAKAAQTFQSIITIYPSDDAAPNNLAYQYAELNDKAHLQQALALVNGAIAKLQAQSNIDDDMRAMQLGEYQDTLGWVQYRLGQYSPAIATLQKAIGNDPREAEMRYHLGMAYLALDGATAAGMGIDAKAAARSEFQSALVANPTLASAKDALSKLGPDTTASRPDDISDMLQ